LPSKPVRENLAPGEEFGYSSKRLFQPIESFDKDAAFGQEEPERSKRSDLLGAGYLERLS
jgi:hypothetical protein